MVQKTALELSESQYASRRKALLHLLKKLRASGSQEELDLPRIAVIGNQSAGKSSVVEAISGITVPRDAGTCTRCPMECRMTSSTGRWTCSISIRREYDETGILLPHVKELPFGKPIYEKGEVELQLRRAQIAVLNPHLEFTDIMTVQSAEQLTKDPFVTKDTLKFSRNTICIDLEGPELADLAFVDLPGIIQNAEPDIVKLVEDMVVSHIGGNCLILVALPMTDDIENQRAMRLAKQEDPKGDRTIGVLTKPDMLTSGATKARDIWLDVIEGRREPLVHGYYCTKQPDDAQRAANITSTQARRVEEEFFANTPPWSTSSQKDRFGTVHLIETLSKLLVGIINSTLPGIRSEAARKLERCTGELGGLPQTIDMEPATYMLTLINDFSTSVKKFVEGGGQGDNTIIHKNRDAYATFKVEIRSTAPNFVPVPRSTASEGTADDCSTASAMYVDDMKTHIDNSIARELPSNVPYSGKEMLIVKFQNHWKGLAEGCFAVVRVAMQDMLEKQVKRYFSRYENLEGHVRVFVSEIVGKHYDACLTILRHILKVEQSPFTQNTHYLSDTREKWLTIYKGIRSGKQPLRKKRKVAIQSPNSSSEVFIFGAPGSQSSSKKSTSNGTASQQSSKKAAVHTVPPETSASPFSFSANPTPIPAVTKPRSAPAVPTNGKRPFRSFKPLESSDSESEAEEIRQAPSTSRSQRKATQAEIQTVQNGDSDEDDDDNHNGPSGVEGSSSRAGNGPNLLSQVERSAKVNQLLASLAELGYHGIKEENLNKLVEPDTYERELAAMAEVRGYFQVAYKRITDNVPNLIDNLFVRPIGEDIATALITKLALGTPDANDRCAIYLAESPGVVTKRRELLSRKRRLEEVKDALQTFGLS